MKEKITLDCSYKHKRQLMECLDQIFKIAANSFKKSRPTLLTNSTGQNLMDKISTIFYELHPSTKLQHDFLQKFVVLYNAKHMYSF